MADIKTNQSKVYNALKGMGFSGIGASEQEFAAKMSNPKNRAKVYKALSERGYKGIGKDQAAFDTLIYRAPATAEPQHTQTPAGKTASTVAQPAQPTQQPAAQPQKAQQPKQTYKPTDMEMMGFGMTINSAQGAVDAAKESLDRTIQNQETFRKQQPLGGGVAKSAPKFNAETGQMEQTYITSAGTEHTDKNQAEDIQRRLRDAAWREAHPLEAAERENAQDRRDIRMEEERLTERRKAAEGEQPQGWWETFKRNFAASAITGMAPMGSNVDRDMVEAEMTRHGAYGAERQGIQKEQDMLLARRRLAEETQQLLADVRRDREIKGIGSGLLRAGGKVLETALNPRTWDFGEADMASQFAVADAVMKADSGLGLSSNEQKLLDTWAKNAAINGQFADQLSGWTKAGMVTGESLPFMLEMAMNPASGLGEAATAQLVKYSLKKYGTKWVKDHAKSMLAKKIATRLIGDVVGAGVMANTTGIARVAADAQSRMTGQVDIQLDPNGDVIYKGVKDAESPGAAIFKAMASTSIENWSEMAGNYLGFINSFFGKALGKSVVGKAGRKMLAETGSIEGVSLNKAQKFIYELAAGKGIGAFNQGLAQFAKRTQWHGAINEYLEEEIGNIANAAIVGDMTFDTKEGTGVFNLQQNIDTFCGVALMGGFMSALNTVGYVGHRINYDVDRVSNANAQLFGDDLWRRIRTTIDSSISDPRGLNDTLTDLVRGDGGVFDENGKKAILKYTQAALEKQGAEMAQYQPRMASSTRQKNNETGGWEVSSMDKNGDFIETQAFETEDEAKAYEGELKMNQQWQDYRDNLSMTNKLSYPEAAQAVDEFIRGLGDGFDYAETVAAINDPKSELGQRFLQFKTEKILQKAEANRQAIEAFEEENGWTPGTVQWLSEQDPMQLDAEGLAMADQARDFLEGLAYPAGEVHVEHEQQIGADTAQAVVENVISTEEPIDPNNNAGQQLMDAYKASLNNMTALFDRNEEIKEEFYRLQGMGLSPQEIISSLDSFRPEDVQTIIDWYNANARYQSFMDEASRQIDRVAHSNRERRTFHGTINGNADNQNVIVISDGTNSYTLVSGNVTMDVGGRITGTDSGLIIGLDENGDFVQLGDGSGYSVMPGAMSLDQWEEMERERLQQQVSLVVDPAGAQAEQEAAAQPQGTEQTGAELDNAGGEAGAASGTGANDPSATVPVTPTPPAANATGTVADTSGNTAGTPAVSIESVTDKDGIKRYENGVGVDDAIADIQNDGLDVGEVADASIAEAQQTIDKINGKATKTRKDLMDRKKAQDVIDYYQALKERAAMLSQGTEEAPANGEENVNNQPEQPVSGGNVVPSQTVQTVEEQKQERIKALKAELGELFDDDFTKANDVYELVSMWIGRKRNLAWDDVNGKRGLQKELGWTRKIGGDTKYIETLLAKKGEGIGVDEFVHMVWESPENSVGEEKRWTTEEIKEALLDLLKSAQSKSDVVDYAVNSREQAARAALEAQQQMEQEAAAQQPAEVEVAPPTDEEIADMEANLPFTAPVEGEDIPENPLTALWDVIREVSQDGGMPAIRMVDTDQMTDSDWEGFASDVYGGAFLSDEDVDAVRNNAMEMGIAYNPNTDVLDVFSGAVTAESLRDKLEQFKLEYNGRENEGEAAGSSEGRGDSDLAGVRNEVQDGEGSETPAAAGAAGTESQGSPESAVDEYLQPRNEKEEQIIADVMVQLQQEIDAAIKERDKAANDLQKAQAKESDRATDMFSDDEAFQEPGQLFSFDEMGGTDRTQEGVNRRTEAERKAFEEAKKKVDQLQSEPERNSRIRGALDNVRRQTSFETDNPIEAIEQAAQQFREEQTERQYGADNKLVSRDRYEELRKRMIQKLTGQLNAGFDPEILAIGTEMAMFHIEAGARKFVDFAEKMIADLGDAIRPYLKAIYNGAREMPGMEELRKEMTSAEGVSFLDVQNIANTADNSVNEHKQENNEQNNSVSLQQEAEETVERKAEDADKYRAFSQAVANDMLAAMESGEKPYKSIKDIRAKAKEVGLEVDDEGRTDILLQELVEDGLVSAARQYVNTYVIQQMLSGRSAAEVRQSRDLFNDIVKLYNLQPTISQRSSNRIKMQQYSTPLPMSFVADVFAFREGMTDVLEPTAGNGMMVFAIPEFTIHANELDGTRLENLRAQKFKQVTDQDATKPFEGDTEYDAIVANPPFGSAEAKDYDGKQIPGLAEQIALNALEKMKDDGKAAIIIGGNMEYAPNGALKNQKAFFTYLYDHYNVKGVIDMDGKLYQKQGTTYPTRLILIDGRRSEEERAQTKVYPPVQSMAPKKATTFDELFDIAEEIRNNKDKTNGNEVLRSAPRELESHTIQETGQTNKRVDNRQPRTDAQQRNGTERSGSQPKELGGQTERGRQDVLGGSRQTVGDSSLQRENRPSDGVSGQRGRTETDRTAGSQSRTTGGNTSNTTNGVVGESHTSELARRDLVEEKRELSSDKLPYRPHNGAFSLESVAPAAMVEAMDNTLKSIEKEYGNIDDFVTKELGYDSVEEMHNALAAEQVDSVAMAIWNMKNGEGMIIGDQTGVGKGRQMASLIRWAVKQGKKPIFVTKDADLFSDIYRDLVDIGSGELRPFIFNAGVTITDANGVVVHKSLSDATQKKVLAMNELPDGFDFAILSYPQMNTGDAISQEESGKAAKDRGERGIKKGKAVKAGRPTPKADFLRRIAKDNYLLMDESQNAAGSGNTGAYFQSILKDAKAVTFASATFAKRPDTMPLYAIRTAISKAKVKTWELLQMIGKGGVTLQEIMSRAMTQAGQMVRRERDMSDVKTDWKTITDKATAEKARRNYDNVMRAFNAIIDFQENYIKPALDAKSMEFASMASTVTGRRGTEKAGVDNPPFVNRLYNFSKQLLLSLKVDAVVDEVVSEIEAGRHPVIALENTLESALDEYGVGDVIEDPTLFGKLKKGLDATFRYTLKDEDGNEMGGELQPHELGAEGEQAYYNLVDLIQESTQGMFISPLDAITEKLEAKGYSVGEISGRKTRAVLNNDGKYVVRKRENTDRKKLARDFNSGAVDVLIINKTGSTGISLHASNRFSDQRQRTMIMAQPLSDINDYMQMIGRIDRTGQVHRGYYINLGLPVPAETRFMMMLANKLKSLNANTTTSQENKDNDVDAPDLLNKYGDQVMIEYLRDNPDVYRKLGEFLKGGKERGSEGVSAAQLDEYLPKEGDARQITGRVALLSVDEQDAFYDDVTRRYNELIKYLNDTGSNDLKISVLPLNARTIAKEVSSEGTAPNSNNPFADNAYVEWVEMDILKKPMKASDVGKTIEQLNPEVEAPKVEAKTAAQEKALNGKLTSRVRQIISIVEKETQEKLDKENERYEAAKKRAEEDIAAKTETINKQQKRTPEQKKETIDKYADEKRKAVEESHQNMVNKIDANHERLMRYLKMFEVGDSVLVPDDLTTDAFLGSSNGIFCGFKTKDEGITPSTTLAVFATLDGRRKIEVKLSDWGALTRIDNMTQQNWDAAHEVTLSNWDEKIPSSSRKHGYIMTGNILQAISDTNFQGRLVTFTDNQGNVRDGVLMPDKWEPSQLKGATVPISARKERITSMPMKESVKSSDGRVVITRYWEFYTLEVPKSKKQGGEFYLDKALLDLVDDNDFFTLSNKMRARVDNSNIDAVLDRLGEMSVTLPSDRKVEFGDVEEEQNDMASGYSEDIEEDELNTLEGGYSEETDEEVIERLEKEPKIKVYRAMSLIDGKLYPPMATKQDGQLREPIELGKWEKSDEHPEKAVKRNGKWVFKLTKDNGKSLFAAYNPYIHTSTTMLNDQFSEAQNRPNLVVVEVEVPESELTSGYKAEKAKDAVGRLEWKAGIIQGQLTGTREVILSRWDKPVRIVPTEEVAKSIAKQINGKVEVMPTNVVTPAQREALEKEGVKFVETDNRGKIVGGPNKGKTYSSVYGKKAKNSGYSEGEAKAKPQPTRHKENIRKHVENLLNKLGTRNRTTVITSINGVRNKARREHIENMHKQGKKVYGWFENGRIYLYLPDIDSVYKAEQTIWHETVAHVGLRELLGAENYGKLLNRLWMQHKDGEMGEWVSRRMQVNGWSLHKAIDEWLAREAEKVVAERQERRTLWQKLAGWVGDILREIGYRTNPTITDVRYLFWLSENQLREGEPMSAIKRAAFLHRLERENRTAELQRSTKRGSDMDAGYSEDIDDPLEFSEKAVYDERLNRVETVFTEAYQDSMIALKTAQNAIAHDKAIPDSQNAYMAENLMHGKNKNEQDLFNSMFRDPLINTINKIMNATGMNWGDVDRYVYTKSGLERNREFFVRDWLERERNKSIRKYEDLTPEEQDIFDRKAEVIETLFEDGDIETEEQKEKELAKALQETHREYIDDIENRWIALKERNYLDLQIGDINFADYLAGLTNFILDNIDSEYNPSENDYSGFRAMYGDEEGKYDEDAIIDELMNTEDAIEAENVDTLWEKIQNATRYGLERYREAGMRSDEQIDRVEQMFHWYVPMRGFKEDKGEDMYQYFTGKGKAKNYVGGLLKHAKGRGSEANYPISTIFAMTYKAISDCNQNLVNQKLYRLCQANPNDLVVLSDSWARLNEQTGEWEEVAPEIGDDMDEEEILEATLAFEEDMRQLASDGKAKKIKGKEHFDYKPMDKKKKSEHIVDVRINGQQKRMIVVGNPRMAQALNGQLRFEHGRNVFSKWNATIKNFMASVFTSYSPTFALRNMFRDWTHFRTMLGVREGHGYASQANKYYRQSLFKMVGLFKKYREGRLDESIEMERDFKDFMDNGGITGFVFMQKLDDIQKDMENIYKKQKAGKPIRLNNTLWEKILGAVEALNEGIENNARFATYRASRHYAGRTRARSAYDAKEITVNFNRKGAGSKTYGFKSQSKKVEDAAKVFGITSQVLGEGRIFFNATVQAIATTFKNFQNADGSLNKGYIAKWAGKYALPPFMFGLALPLINKALAAAFGGDGDDDPYANLPEWTRRRNLCFYIGHGNFITIPIGQELAAFLTLGDIAAGNTYAPDLKPVDKSWDDEIVGVMNTFSPVDISTKITKGGLMEDPISEVTGRTFSVLAPLVAVEQNLAWTGRPIYREDRFGNDQYTPEYQMVYSGTNPVLVNATKLLHEIGGGDDIVRGKMEVNPAIIQYLWEQYTGGPGKVFSNTISIGKDAKDILSGNESEFNIRKVEGLKAFVQQGDDRTEYYRANAKYRKYKADAERLYDAVKGYEGGAVENPEYVLKLEQISKGEDFVRMQIVMEADKQLSQINKAANKAEGAERKELRRLYNEQVKEVVDMLDEVGE